MASNLSIVSDSLFTAFWSSLEDEKIASLSILKLYIASMVSKRPKLQKIIFLKLKNRRIQDLYTTHFDTLLEWAATIPYHVYNKPEETKWLKIFRKQIPKKPQPFQYLRYFKGEVPTEFLKLSEHLERLSKSRLEQFCSPDYETHISAYKEPPMQVSLREYQCLKNNIVAMPPKHHRTLISLARNHNYYLYNVLVYLIADKDYTALKPLILELLPASAFRAVFPIAATASRSVLPIFDSSIRPIILKRLLNLVHDPEQFYLIASIDNSHIAVATEQALVKIHNEPMVLPLLSNFINMLDKLQLTAWKARFEEKQKVTIEEARKASLRLIYKELKKNNTKQANPLRFTKIKKNNSMADCEICYDEFQKNQTAIRCTHCQNTNLNPVHKYCFEDSMNLESANRTGILHCPICNKKIDVDMGTLRHLTLINKEKVQRDILRIKHKITKKSQPCNGSYCEFLISKTHQVDHNNAICPICTHNQCLRCGFSHPEMNCDSFKKIDRYDKQFEELLDANIIRKCPNCNSNIFKDGGCDHIVCGQCGQSAQWSQLSI